MHFILALLLTDYSCPVHAHYLVISVIYLTDNSNYKNSILKFVHRVWLLKNLQLDYRKITKRPFKNV